jgi:hypothetical protein
VYKQLKLVFLVDALLGLLYAFFSFSLWGDVNRLFNFGYGTQWSALKVTAFPIAESIHMVPVQQMNNIPFWIFWIMLAANLYFIIKLERNREVKQSTT